MSEGNEGKDSIKIILLGESGVGKTNLINVAMNKEFEQNTISSIHSSYLEGTMEYNNREYPYALWDTAGQEIYRALNKIFIKGAKIVICVYAIDNKESFNQIEYWINNAKETLGEKKYIMALLANKSDLFEEQTVPDDDGRAIADKYKMKFKITSACSDAEGFKLFLKELIIDYINFIGPEAETTINFKLKKNVKEEKVKKKRFC